MGAAVASNLLRNNVSTVLYDIEGDKNVPDPLKQSLEGAVWAESARAAAEISEVVITALPRPEHVTAAFLSGDDGILAGMRPGTIWIEHSTTDFENTNKIKELVEEKGGSAIEAPLTGGMQILREGKMVTLVGADEQVLSKARDLISLSAPRIVHCGDFGHATIIKIFSNILCAVHDVAIGEALCVAKKAGIDMKTVFDAMRVSSGNSFCWETEVPRMLKGDYYPDFTAKMMHKDISLGLQLGEKYNVHTPTTQYVAKKYEEAMDIYGEDSGSSIPCRIVEDKSGVRLCDMNSSGGSSAGKSDPNSVFQDWTYTTEIKDGSYLVKHLRYDNPYSLKDK